MTHSDSTLPSTSAECHLAGLEFLESGRVLDAVRLLRRALDLDPARAAAWNDLGVILEALGNPRDAVYCYRRALLAPPQMEEPRRNLFALAMQAAAAPPPPPSARPRVTVAVAR